MITLKQIKISAKEVSKGNISEIIKSKICKKLKLKLDDILYFEVLKESIDARKKPDIFYTYNIVIKLQYKKEMQLLNSKNIGNIVIDSYENQDYVFPKLKNYDFSSPIVVGSGPAGLFAAYMLSKEGFKPILFERGSSIIERKEKVLKYMNTGDLDPESNIQFGEGGAGTFSDGKLNTGNKDKLGIHKKVLDVFVEHGAAASILYESKPHIGTDVLEKVVTSMRNEIIRSGGKVFFNSKVSDLIIENNRISAVVVNDNDTYPCDQLILAVGHSARDTFKLINQRNMQMSSKAFAVGIRVIHDQSFINESQYGMNYDYLPTADYKITNHTNSGRGVYSFCMCPGGYVVSAASSNKQQVVNGMSYSKRDGKYANSAMVVTVGPGDFGSDDIFAGLRFQEQLEKRAWEIGHGMTPIQTFESFLNNVEDENVEEILKFSSESVLGKVCPANVRDIFPEKIAEELSEGICLSDKKIKDFSKNIRLIAGVESRTSSPIKILRNEYFESNISGIYPCGEGAGYAGGIMSAAVDGIKVAAAVANKINGEI